MARAGRWPTRSSGPRGSPRGPSPPDPLDATAARELRRRFAPALTTQSSPPGPPSRPLLAARTGGRIGDPPLVVELRDLWAGNPALRSGAGGSPGALEAAWSAPRQPLCRGHAGGGGRRAPAAPKCLADRVWRSPTASRTSSWRPPPRARSPSDRNDDPPLGHAHRGPPARAAAGAVAREPPLRLFRLWCTAMSRHPSRPDRCRRRPGAGVELVGPSAWEDAVARIAAADVALVSQAAARATPRPWRARSTSTSRSGGRCWRLSAGGATEAVLRGVGADAYCARLDDEPRSRAPWTASWRRPRRRPWRRSSS